MKEQINYFLSLFFKAKFLYDEQTIQACQSLEII